MPDLELKPRHRSWAQPVLVAGAAFLWALFWVPTPAALVPAYLLAWLGLALARGLGAPWAELRMPAGLALALISALLTPAAYFVATDAEALLHNSQLSGRGTVLAHRAALRQAPALHPPVLELGRPQVFWIHAPDGQQVELQLPGEAERRPARRVGPGLFRAALEAPRNLSFDDAAARVWVDGVAHPRNLTVTPARVRPTRLGPGPTSSTALAVCTETDALLVIEGPGAVRSLSTLDGPSAAAAGPDGSAWVAHRYAPDLAQVDLQTGEVRARHPVGLGQADVARLDGHLAVALEDPPGLRVGPEGGPLEAVALPAAPERVVFGPDRDTLVVASRRARRLYRLRRAPSGAWRRDGAPLVLGRPARALARGPGGARIVLAVSDLRPNDDAGPNHRIAEQLVTVDVAGWRIVDREALDPARCAGVAGLDPVTGLAACEGTDRLRSGAGVVDSPLVAPSGVLGRPGVVISAVAGTVAWIDARGALIATLALGTDDPDEARLRRGERVYTEATRSGASCATCHPDADSDYALHDIGHGQPRPTLSVRGLAHTAPYLRGASYPTLAGLDGFAQTLLGGYPRADPDRADRLTAFVEGLAPRFSPARWAPDVEARLEAGYAAFRAAACPDCHPPPAFTDLAQYPRPLLFPGRPPGVLLDTPSLIGVGSSAPYLFDGRAGSLRAVFEDHDPARRHGRYERLDEAQRDALFAFLEAL